MDVNQPLILIPDINYRFRPYSMLFKITNNLDDKNALYNAFLKIGKYNQ